MDAEGHKHVLGIQEGATENAAAVQDLLEGLVRRGVQPAQKRLFVIDGSKALRAAIRAVFGAEQPVQRCRAHKLRNVLDRLPEPERDQVRAAMRAAWRLDPKTGRAKLEKLAQWSPPRSARGSTAATLPGTCNSTEVNAALLEAAPSDEKLQEFVRCAAMELESKGYFATITLSTDPRWRNGSIYLFGLDTYGNALFSGDPYSQGYGTLAPELNDYLEGPFGGRDVVSIGDAFGETFLYYSTRNPSTGMPQRKVTFVKRVLAYGLPILVGSGYYLDEGVRPGLIGGG